MKLADRLLSLDRRIIFILVALATLIPLLWPVGLPVRVSPEVQKIYDYMESLPEGSALLLSFDFEPSSKPELYPMAIALLHHAFRKNLRVIGMTMWVAGTGMAEKVFTNLADEWDKEKGVDYVFLGYTPGGSNVIINMGQDMHATFPTDHYGNRTAELPMMKDLRSLRDIDYLICLAAGRPGIEEWYIYGKEKYGFELGGGCTAVMAAGLYPFLDTGQINGLMGGLRGAAEYETLVGLMGKAVGGMDAQSVTHFLIIFLIILCNILYFIRK